MNTKYQKGKAGSPPATLIILVFSDLPEYSGFFTFVAGEPIQLLGRALNDFSICAEFFNLSELVGYVRNFTRNTSNLEDPESAVFELNWADYRNLIGKSASHPNPIIDDDQLTASVLTTGVNDMCLADASIVSSIDSDKLQTTTSSELRTNLNSSLNSQGSAASATNAGTDKTINPINQLQEYCVIRGIAVTYKSEKGKDGKWEVRCRISEGSSEVAYHETEKVAKIFASKAMLELLTNETIILEKMDEPEDITPAVEYLKLHLTKKGKGGRGQPLPLPDHDPKSCFNLISSNYPQLLKLEKMEFTDVGTNSHCPFFKFEAAVKVTVVVREGMKPYQAEVKAVGRYRDKKNAEKITTAKVFNKAVAAIQEISKIYGPIQF